MPKDIERDEVQRLMQNGARVVEVLPHADYDQFHLPGALSIPLETITRETTAQLTKDQPIITYCHDTQ